MRVCFAGSKAVGQSGVDGQAILSKLNSVKSNLERLFTYMTHQTFTHAPKPGQPQVQQLGGRDLSIARQISRITQDQLQIITSELESVLSALPDESEPGEPSGYLYECNHKHKASARSEGTEEKLAQHTMDVKHSRDPLDDNQQGTQSQPKNECLNNEQAKCQTQAARVISQDTLGKDKPHLLNHQHTQTSRAQGEGDEQQALRQLAAEWEQSRGAASADLEQSLGEQKIEELCSQLRKVHHLATDAMRRNQEEHYSGVSSETDAETTSETESEFESKTETTSETESETEAESASETENEKVASNDVGARGSAVQKLIHSSLISDIKAGKCQHVLTWCCLHACHSETVVAVTHRAKLIIRASARVK